MHYLSLDNCYWVYFANGTEPVKLLDYFYEKSRQGIIKIILPKIVKDEWEKSKEKSIQENALKHYKNILKT
jgi:hypothetical protein